MPVKFLALLFIMTSCAQHRGPASPSEELVASDTLGLGKVKASAVKVVKSNQVCFDITLVVREAEKKIAEPSNWTMAWVDKDAKYHLLSSLQRDPASTPKASTKISSYGSFNEWTSYFETCTSRAPLHSVKALVLTPKELPFKETKSMSLEWK